MTLIGALQAEKIAEAFLLFVFRITFPASPLFRLLTLSGGSASFLLVSSRINTDGVRSFNTLLNVSNLLLNFLQLLAYIVNHC